MGGRRHFKCPKCGQIFVRVDEKYIREHPTCSSEFIDGKREEHRDWCPDEEEITEVYSR